MRITIALTIPALLLIVGCQSGQPRSAEANAGGECVVEAGCATCIFEMEGVTGCRLAARIDGVAYLVEGSDIDDHGDAHAADGLCNTARSAKVEGEVNGDRFVATRFELLP